MDANKMKIGAERAVIKAKNIHGKSYQNNVNMTAAVMQSAFDYYYNAHRAIDKIELPPTKYPAAHKLMKDKKYELQKNLWRACDKNLNIVSDDLMDVFRHLAEKKGHWYDESSDGWENKCNIPMGVSDFLDTVKENGITVSNKYYEWLKCRVEAERLQREKKWGELADKLSNSQKLVDYALPFLWIMAVQDPEKINPTAGLISKWIGYGANVHQILDTTIKVSSNPANWKRAALEELSKFVVNKVPIFGSLYAGVISDLPQLIKWFENYATRMKHIIDNANNPNG